MEKGKKLNFNDYVIIKKDEAKQAAKIIKILPNNFFLICYEEIEF